MRDASLLDHAFQQWQATPEMRIEDAYKWLFHATLGGEHAVQDDSGPRAWLDAEWPTLAAPMDKEPATVPLTPDGRLLRVNLRPYKQRGGDKEMLLWAFVVSAQRFHQDRTAFATEWDALGRRLSKRAWNRLTRSEWERLNSSTRKSGFPAIEHSAQYIEKYRPAYRVVLREVWIP